MVFSDTMVKNCFITVEDGLAGNSIRQIKELNGDLFIESSAGVSKYSNGTFETLKVDSTRRHDWLLTDNDLWFSCNGYTRDIYRYDGEVLQLLELPRQDLYNELNLKPQDPSQSFGYSPYSVFGVQKDPMGNLWIGTFTACAFKYDGEQFTWFGEQELSSLPDGRVPGVRSMPMDQEGYYWLSNIKHKYQSHNNGTYSKLPGIDLSQQNVDIGLPYFMSSTIDKDNNLWMVTYGNGVWKYDGEKLEQIFLEMDGKEVLLICIHRDREDRLWLGTDNDGAWMLDDGTWKKMEPKGIRYIK